MFEWVLNTPLEIKYISVDTDAWTWTVDMDTDVLYLLHLFVHI